MLMRGLFPALARDIDAAFDALQHTGSGQADDTVDFESQLDAEVQQFQKRHAALAWHDLSDAGARDRVLNAFEVVREVLRDSSIELPAPESFAANVEFERVAELLGPSTSAALAVVPAPHGIGLSGWRELYQLSAQRFPEKLNSNEPLIVGSEAEREFALLDARLDGATTSSWTLRLVPATPAPGLLGLNFEHGPHVTLPEMLMLQLMRITSGAEPLDQASFTWIAGALVGGKLAARHVYDVADRAVRISCREIGNQGPHLGARPPIALD